MSRANQRPSEGSNTHRRPSVRQQATALRELGDPLGLLRAVRYMASLVKRDIDTAEWDLVVKDVHLRCAEVDPLFEAMSQEELVAMRRKVDPDAAADVESSGMKRNAIEDYAPDKQLLASRVGEIRAVVHRIGYTMAGLTQERAEHLERLAAALHADMADPALPLSGQEQRIWDLLLQQPEDKPLTNDKIVARLRAKGRAVSTGNTQRALLGPLRAKGVRNRKRVGYFIPVEFRC